MDKIVSTLPMVLFGNGVADILSAVDPTGMGDNLLSNGAFKSLRFAEKGLVVGAFSQSMLIHGVIRVLASRNLHDKNMKLLVVASYLAEIYQAVRLVNAGAMVLPEGLVFIAGPIGVICLILSYKTSSATKDDKKN